ncbi:MAG: U32 family peptidase, partial [Clostridia bacterium]|nr:U32 family peptidase [Clostridia bacterium]
QKAHSFGTKVYLTVNTLVSDDEMPRLVQTVKSAVEAQVDAYLVQDAGVCAVLKECFPGINLHSSTQMGVHNLKGAQIAEKLGYTRIVLSREAKLEDIKQIKENTNLEIEYFVQGALCIAFSGNCYFSGMMQDDSGNRGRCKQYCRMKYTPNIQPEKFNEKYMLSARDLCLIGNLSALIDAGVTSFKIEGRLRRSGYVAQAVQSYKKAVDYIMQQKVFDVNQEIFALKKVFSRGDFLQRAYLDKGVPSGVVNVDVQNHLGIEIGKVLEVKPFKDLLKVSIQSLHEIHTGDGLKFLDNGTQVCSLGVGNVEKTGKNTYNIFTKHKLKKGYVVNLILDSVMEDGLLQVTRKIAADVQVFAEIGKPLTAVLCAQGVSTKFVSSYVPEKAKNAPTTMQEICTQFGKLGDTNFVLNNFEGKIDNVFVPKSVLNNFRREAIAQLQDEVIAYHEKDIKAKVNDKKINDINNKSVPNSKFVNTFDNIIVVNEDNLQTIATQQNKLKTCLIALRPNKYNLQVLDEFVSKLKDLTLALDLPIIANYKDLQILDEILNKHQGLYVIANNIYGMSYASSHPTIAGAGMNIFNDYAVKFWQDFGCVGCVLSVEQQLDKINQKNVYVYSVGYVPLMTMAHCPYKTIWKNDCSNCKYQKGLEYSDVHGNNFAIRRTTLSQCYFEVLHSHLINNLGHHSSAHFVDLRELNSTQVEVVLQNLSTNTKCKITDSDILGKIESAVK